MKINSQLIALQELMQLETLLALQIHGVRWLSRGQVIEILVLLMPPILTLWKNERKESWYDKTRIFLVQFCLHMLADIMCEINKLNKQFQEVYIDVISLGVVTDVTVNTLKRWFLRRDTFTYDTCCLYKFIDASKFGFLEIFDEGLVHKHEL